VGTLALSLMVAAVGASPAVVVLPIRTTAVAPERALAVAGVVAQALQAEGIALAATPSEAAGKLRAQGADPLECRGEASCAARLGAKLGASLVAGVGVSEFEGSVAVHVEVVEVLYAGRALVEDQVLPSDLKDPLWPRALAPFARKLRERMAAAAAATPPPPPPTPTAPPAAAVADAGSWVISLQADAELDAFFGGMITVRAGRRFLPALTVSAGAVVTGARVAGVAVQARAVPFAGDRLVHPVVALEVPVLLRSSPAAGVRPSLGVEVTPLPWLSLAASASYLQLVGAPAAEVKTGYWLAGAEVGFRL